MLEVTLGQTKNHTVAKQLKNILLKLNLDGSLYIGYPVLATADKSVTVDALLVSRQHGLLAFMFGEHLPVADSDVEGWVSLADRQDQLFVAVENNLRRHDTLRDGRRLGVQVQTVTIIPSLADVPDDLDGEYTDLVGVPNHIRKFPKIDERYFKPLQAALQRVTTIKPPKRRKKVILPESKGAILKQIEKEIANLDQWQKRAAIESPDGPQRIRGLAGSGKTIVLALKAAYLHAQNPDWIIAVTFWSRSLYQQFEDLVRRFSFEHMNDEPNWLNLRILHAWGSRTRDGVYRQIAMHCGITPRDFLYGKSRYGMDEAFQGVCSEFLSASASSSPKPIYDAVLIDEAQDLPIPFFKMVHKLTHPPKRIIWAYDELQRLSESAIPSIDQQFGVDPHGEPIVRLVDSDDAPHQDIVLPICYRNTPWAIALAHGLGLGTARTEGLVQSFDELSLWKDIGYRLVEGRFKKGSTVTVERAPDSFPTYFQQFLSQDEAVSSHAFANTRDQAQWVAENVRRNLADDELDHDDILIVLPDVYTAKSQAGIILEELNNLGIEGHLAGVTASQDEIFQPDSIAVANIYRSKGNESPMVYILNTQYCLSGRGLITLRNILFTSITRSKAWVRLCGWGDDMIELKREIDSIADNNFRLQFQIPTDKELEHMRRIHRDLTENEQAKVDNAKKQLQSFIESLDRGDISIGDLPIELRSAIVKHLGESSSDSS